MEKINLKSLVENGLHFGHQTSRWCPKMKPYIWGQKNGVHLIDVSKTARGLEKAASFVEELARDGKSILWVGTKKPAQEVVRAAAIDLNLPYVSHRWIGGLLTNYLQVKKSVAKLLHFEDVLSKSEQFHYTKKELNLFQKVVERLKNNIGGIRKFKWPVSAVIIFDTAKESTALREANECGIPVIALVDTNSDPSGVSYVIPGNDDSPKSIKFVVDYLANAYRNGKNAAKNAAPVEDVEEVITTSEVEISLNRLEKSQE
jgi:small subunit ribosomal protein S2